MRYTTALLALAATVVAQGGEPIGKAPSAPNPGGCQDTVDYTFGYTPLQPRASKRDVVLVERQNVPDRDTTVIELTNGILVDNRRRTGSIVANRQFQFDGPPQAGAEYTGGWCILGNSSLVLGDQTVFYQCGSGNDGSGNYEFFNLYDAPVENAVDGQCLQVLITAVRLPYPKLGLTPSLENVEVDADPVTGNPDGSSATIDSSSSSSSPSSLSSSSGSSSSSSEASTTEESSTTLSTATSSPSIAAPTTVVPAPAGTAPAGTATGVVPPTVTGPTTAPSPFVGAGSVMAAGQRLLGLAVGAAAFALF